MVTANPMAFEKLKGWDSLAQSEKAAIKKEHTALTDGMERLGKAWIEVGERLKALRDVLEPHGMFDSYLKLSPFGLSRSTAYRRIRVAEKARRYLKPDLFRFALLSGLDKVNVETIKIVPPPKSSDPKVMREYLRTVSGHPKVAFDAEVMKKECVNFIRTRWEKLPAEWAGRKKSDWMRSLCGMAMNVAGVSGEQKIEVEAIPIDWGRRKAS